MMSGIEKKVVYVISNDVNAIEIGGSADLYEEGHGDFEVRMTLTGGETLHLEGSARSLRSLFSQGLDVIDGYGRGYVESGDLDPDWEEGTSPYNEGEGLLREAVETLRERVAAMQASLGQLEKSKDWGAKERDLTHHRAYLSALKESLRLLGESPP